MSCLSTEIDKRFYALAINADNVVANEEKLKRLFLWLYDYKSELPRDVKRRESGYLGDVLDLTSLNCFSIDKLDTRIREDALSVKELPAGGFQFGVHVSAGARQIIPGSPAEILARRRGSSSIPTFGDKEYPFRCFAEPFRKLFDLNPKRNSVTFSLMFETDASYNIKPDTYELRLAEIQNARALSFEQAANLLNGAGVRAHESALVQHLQHARALVHAQNSRGSSFADSSALIKPVDIAYGLLSIFNSYAHKLLEEQEIELPPPLQSGLGAGRVKFNAPVRDYKVLLAQRQLDRFLEGREPLSSSEMQQQLDSTGVSAIRSSAFRLIAVTEELRMRAPSATVVLQSGGQLSVLGRPDSLTSPFARADEPEDESEGE
jgi:hypothetical protein